MTVAPINEMDFAGCRAVDIFCSSPFYVRHALTIAGRFRAQAPVTFWYKSGGPLEKLLRNLQDRGLLRTDVWPDTPARYRLSRPWSLPRVRKRLAAPLAGDTFSFNGHCVFYEGDYPEPSLHSIIAFLSRRNQAYRFADEGHDMYPASIVNLRGRLRLLTDRLAYGFRSTPHQRFGQIDTYLNFFDSASYGVRPVSLIPDQQSLTPFLYPINAPDNRPLLVLLESKDEETTCHDYRSTLGRLIADLKQRGWSIVAKGHPRLGNSQAIADLGVPTLEQQVPLEMHDLSRVDAVFGLCSSGMIGPALARIPTYSVEPLFSRIDSAKTSWSINFLKTHPAWEGGEPKLSFVSDWEQLPDAHH
jgi:hypothetical protein